jgi:hypothetical protein
MFATAQPETANATAEKQYGLGNQHPSRLHMLATLSMMVRKDQRLAERRRAKRPEMRGLYVSRPTGPLAPRFAEKVRPHKSGCHTWIGTIKSNGYGVINVNGRITNAYRVAWELAKGPIPDGMWVLHTCDNRRCVNPDHLWLGTQQDNIGDMVGKLRHNHGARNARSKLTAKQVRLIRLMSGTQAEIAACFGVSDATICRVLSGRFWKHVQ